jgi:hypothetical protein
MWWPFVVTVYLEEPNDIEPLNGNRGRMNE